MATAADIIVGCQVWVEDNIVAWIDGDVLEMNDKQIKAQCSNGQDVVTNVEKVYPKNPEAPESGVDDMTRLAYLLMNPMVNEGISQSILVSGESGAVKTEASKNLMQYLAFMGGRPGEGRSVEQQVLERTKDLDIPDLLEQLPALQQLLLRVLGCQPQRAAVHNFVIRLALSM
ncbi:hypothetical protein L1887_03001 [Cichorium endivia]|nr:hypothetical protein L1887_03001 [Cichorium endivia]